MGLQILRIDELPRFNFSEKLFYKLIIVLLYDKQKRWKDNKINCLIPNEIPV
jgi:hypothetical protein